MMLTKSNIGYDGEHFSWNPGGFGCSNGCDGCWARAMAKRFGHCQRCRNFEVHLHEERLYQASDRKKPATILVNFTCDTFDAERPDADISAILRECIHTKQHTFVLLTKNADRAAKHLIPPSRLNGFRHPDSVYFGLTIRNQADADAKLPVFMHIPGKKWISYEPAIERVEWNYIPTAPEQPMHGHPEATWRPCGSVLRKPSPPEPGKTILIPAKWQGIEGIIVGHDNRRGAPGTDTLEHVRSTVEQCRDAGVPVYVKQLLIGGKLRHDAKDFPENLRRRQLPWPTKEGEA